MLYNINIEHEFMTNKMIVGMGEVLWDIFDNKKNLGGAPANFAYNISQFGLKSLVISAVGNDLLGDEIIDVLNKKEVSHNLAKVDRPTGTVHVHVDNKGIPSYEITERVAWDYIPLSPELKLLAKETQVVCFGSLAQRSEVSRNTINSFLDWMPSSPNSMKIFDINLRQKYYSAEVLNSSFNKCNVLKTNDEELEIIVRYFGYDHLDMKDACKELVRMFNFKALILTCGVAGSYIFTPSLVSFYDTPLVDVVDTVGAGDSFLSAFVAATLKGHGVVEAHRFAVDVSAYVCTQPGAMVTFPEELLKRL